MFIIPFKAVPKKRPRFDGKRVYTPKEVKEFEQLVAECFKIRGERSYMNNEALFISIVFIFKIPKSYTKKRRNSILEGKEHYTKKPDLDNLVKAILDGLNGVAYEDDRQIVGTAAFKRYGAADEVEVSIWKL